MSNLWRVDFVGEGPNLEAIVNTFFFDDPTGTSSHPAAVDVAGGFSTTFGATILAALIPDYICVVTRATCVAGDAVGASGEDFSLAGSAGSNPGPAANIVTAGIVRKYSGISQRYARGRNFFGPTSSDYISEDGIFNDVDGLFAAIGAALLDGMSVSVPEAFVMGTLAAASRWPAAIYYMTSYLISSIMGVQRRRRIRPGT